eukprot:CAMPEP_0170650420 /NCGR_PEP_ID=MMETSP0224-20130122/45794_1 /TAXON_ID=285029 /ORGANISM="Togula jolla, Strain CCCM 725" /LENGTH=480 /DNA_ID=CAMNT_0010982083 /DNA_START=102 /DNA_END=1544 /DNA_ORIENTATION=+
MSPTAHILVLFTLAACHEASFSDSAHGSFTINLKRQQIPLHSEDGVVQHKSTYYGQIQVGSPKPQLLDVVFDTGSGHLVVPSAMCRSNTCRSHKRYRRKASVTAEDIDLDGSVVAPNSARDQITISYGTGEVTGIFVRDRICIGQPTPQLPGESRGSSLLQVETNRLSQTKELPAEEDVALDPMPNGCLLANMVVAIEMSAEPFGSFDFDGIFGLGLSSLSQTPDFNVFDLAARVGAWSRSPSTPWSRNIFSVFLGVTDEEQSEITFGGFREEHVKPGSSFAWHEVREAEHGYWQIDVLEIRANGQVIDYCKDGSCRAVLDTGTSILDSSLGPELVDLLRHSSSSEMPCAGPGPVLEFDLGNVTVKLNPEDYARPEVVTDGSYEGGPGGLSAREKLDSSGQVAESSTVAFASSSVAREQMCVPMLMHIEMPYPLHYKTVILGEPVLQKYYTAFDMDRVTPRVGLAEAHHPKPRSPLRMFL